MYCRGFAVGRITLCGETEEEEYGDDDARSFPGAPRERGTREARLYLHTQRAKRGVSGFALLATAVIGESRRRRQCVRKKERDGLVKPKRARI